MMRSWLQRLLIGRRPRRTAVRLVILAAAAFLVFRYLFPPVWIRGESMEPTYRDGALHFANTLSFRGRAPRPGDVVVIEYAGRRVMYLKRVLAGPGSTVAFRDGALLVDGEAVAEPHLRGPCDWTMAQVSLGEDEFFVAGDNRAMPIDQHKLGKVRRQKILGGILF